MLTKKERKAHYRRLFYEQWGSYGNYLAHRARTKDIRHRKKRKRQEGKGNFVLKVSPRACPACRQSCEAVVQKSRFDFRWLPIGFSCECGYKKAAVIADTGLTKIEGLLC